MIKKYLPLIIVLSALTLLGLVAGIYWYFLTLRITSLAPSKGEFGASSVIEIQLNETIANADAIVKDLQIIPGRQVATVVSGRSIRISPIGAYLNDQEYEFTIPEIVASSGRTIEQYSFKRRVNANVTGSEPIQEDINALYSKKYPFLKDFDESSDADYTVTYGLPNDTFTLYVDIQPYLPPAERQNKATYKAKVIEVYGRYLAVLKKYNVEPATIPVIFTPDGVGEMLKDVR